MRLPALAHRLSLGRLVSVTRGRKKSMGSLLGAAKLITRIMASGVLGASAHGQGVTTYDFVPEKWYPLQVGSAWHYQNVYSPDFPVIVERIDRVVSDTTVGGHRWARVKTVWSQGYPIEPAYEAWFRFTADHYLIRTAGSRGDFTPANIDTVSKTLDRSVFTVRSAYEEFLPDQCPSHRPAFADVQPSYDARLRLKSSDKGSVPDSTNFSLVINNDGQSDWYMCSAYFIYKIGPALNLRGAVVEGRRWGYTDQISKLALAVAGPDLQASSMIGADVFPNPARDQVTIRVHCRIPGPCQAGIYDLAGRRVAEAGGIVDWRWEVPGGVASGVYVLRVTDTEGRVLNEPFLITR